METIVKGVSKALLKNERKIGSEAPAISLVLQDGESKVIGMLATKVQVMIILPYHDSLSHALLEIAQKYQEQAFIYFISSQVLDQTTNPACTSTDFEELAKKFGVYIDETLCAKAIFIINKDGQFVYKEITRDVEDAFDLEMFETKLDEAIHFKKKGHVHENWMGA
ncbi:MAG: redoxin protein [Proteobacteria bacterium]|nr:redoxin protein [Pseudomonadota bacterium]